MNLQVSAGNLKVALYLPIWWLFISYKLLKNKWDIVHAADFDTFLPALIISKLKRKKVIYDIFDFYADMLIFPIIPTILRKFFSMVDLLLMKYANAVIIADKSRIKQLKQSKINKLIIVYNSPIETKIESTKNEKFEVFFGGWISKDRSIDKVIEALQNLKNVNLKIIGPCTPHSYEDELINLTKDSANIKLLIGSVPHEEIIKNTIKSDVLFAFYDTSIPNNRFASPNKLFESMMCKKPIIVNENTSMANIVQENNCGLIIPYGDINEIKKAVLKLKDNPKFYTTLSNNSRSAYKTKYSWEIMEKRLLKLYKDMI